MNWRWLNKLNKAIWELLENMEEASVFCFFVGHLLSQDTCGYVHFFTHMIFLKLL